MSPLEIAGFVISVVAVWLTARQNIWCWPIGIASVVIYAIVFAEAKLYSDAGLQVVYVFLQAYGWYLWQATGRAVGAQRPVNRITPVAAASVVLMGIAGTAGLGYVMAKTDAALPWWDAGTTVFSLVAQWLMARKTLECWLLWIAVDVVYVGIYLAKDLRLTAVLYMIFIALACYGSLQWRSDLRKPPAG